MTLKFSGLQPVEFGDKAFKPIIDADKRLRLSQIKFDTKTATERAEEVMASCFGDNAPIVLDFIRSEMGPQEKQLLSIYLQQGEQGLELWRNAYDKIITEQLAKAQEEAEDGKD